MSCTLSLLLFYQADISGMTFLAMNPEYVNDVTSLSQLFVITVIIFIIIYFQATAK